MKWKRVTLGIIILLGIAFLLTNHSNGKTKKTADQTLKTVDRPLKIEGRLHFFKQDQKKPFVSVNINLAENTLERMKGLMFRKNLDEHEGMLFIFKTPKRANFYMRNTFLPLDIIFIDKNNRIISIGEGVPLTETLVPSKGKCLYVLEVNKGFTEKYKVKIGDRMEWKRF